MRIMSMGSGGSRDAVVDWVGILGVLLSVIFATVESTLRLEAFGQVGEACVG